MWAGSGHVAGSKHYINQAADIRTRDVDPAKIPSIVTDLRAQLGSGYTVINEGDHIHVQYNGIGTPLGAAPADIPLYQETDTGGFDLSPIFDAVGLPYSDQGVSEAGLSGGVLVGLIVGGIALLLIFRD